MRRGVLRVMAWMALGGYLLYLALAFGVRTYLQIRETGASGFKGISGRPGSAEHSATLSL